MKTKITMKIKTTIRTVFILTAIIFFGLVFNFFIKSNPAYADAGWFDYSWSHRKVVNITGSASDLTDYQVKITVDFISGKMNSDFSDIRFVSSDNITLLSHWRESYASSSTAEFWVKVPSIPTSGTMIYMYYSNPSANSESNGEATFDFFDKFEPSSSKWAGSGFEHSTTGAGYVRAYKSGTGSVSSDLVSNLIGSGSFKAHLKIKSGYYKEYDYPCGYKLELKLVSDSGESGLDTIWIYLYFDFVEKSYTISGDNLRMKLRAYAQGCEHTVTRCTGWCGGDPDVYYSCNGNSCSAGGNPPSCPAGYSQINYYCDELSWCDPCCYGGCGAGHECWGRDCKECRVCKNPSLSAEAKLWIDDLYVRKYVLPEPIASFGTEEEMLCAFEGESCLSISCCSSPPAPEPLTCVDYICDTCLSLNCSADNAEDNSISEMGDAIDDDYCTWNIHDGCLVKEGVETIDGSNNPSYWEGENCVDTGSSDLWGEKRIYINDINDYNIKGKVCVDDYNSFWINGAQVNVLENGSTGCKGLIDVRSFFQTGWNTIKFKAVDTCSDNRYMDIDWQIIPRAPALNGIASSSSKIKLSWDDRGTGVTYGLWNSDIGTYIYSGDQTSFVHTGLDANTTYSYEVIATKNGYDSDWSNTVSATTWNQPPVADAGSDQFVIIGSSVNLDGSGSDPDGDPITYRWDYKGSSNGNLVSRWHFDENSGDIAYDTSGANNNDGTLKPASPVWTTGKIGNALEFNGVDDYVDCGDNASLQLGINMTVEAWINPSSNVLDWARIVGKGDNINRNYGLWRESDGDILWQIYNADLNGNCWNNGGPGDILNASVGNWMHIVGTYNGTDMKIYTNGVLRKVCPYDKIPCTSFDPTTIGYVDFHTFFNGSIDEVKIYNKALSKNEIENLYEFGTGTLISDPFSLTPAFIPDTIGVYHIDLIVTDSYGGFHTDTVSITVADPTVCGDNNIQCPNSSGLCEECDGTDDALCPGECIAPRETRECLCPQSMPSWKEVKPKN